MAPTKASVIERLLAWHARLGGPTPVRIETLEYQGWAVRIDLAGTGLRARAAPRRLERWGERSWLNVWAEGTVFHGTASPDRFGDVLELFLAWADPGSAPDPPMLSSPACSSLSPPPHPTAVPGAA